MDGWWQTSLIKLTAIISEIAQRDASPWEILMVASITKLPSTWTWPHTSLKILPLFLEKRLKAGTESWASYCRIWGKNELQKPSPDCRNITGSSTSSIWNKSQKREPFEDNSQIRKKYRMELYACRKLWLHVRKSSPWEGSRWLQPQFWSTTQRIKGFS